MAAFVLQNLSRDHKVHKAKEFTIQPFTGKEKDHRHLGTASYRTSEMSRKHSQQWTTMAPTIQLREGDPEAKLSHCWSSRGRQKQLKTCKQWLHALSYGVRIIYAVLMLITLSPALQRQLGEERAHEENAPDKKRGCHTWEMGANHLQASGWELRKTAF